jgi:hypothetical protein
MYAKISEDAIEQLTIEQLTIERLETEGYRYCYGPNPSHFPAPLPSTSSGDAREIHS